MSEALQKKVTPTAAFRALTAPYRAKLEQSDDNRAQLEGRIRRAFDLWEKRQREIWATDPMTSETQANGANADTAA